MTREEYLQRAAALHTEWSLRYADRIPADPGVSDPHDGESDLAEHHHDVSAPSAYDDILNEKLTALTEQYQAAGGR